MIVSSKSHLASQNSQKSNTSSPDGDRTRPLETVQPLATDLGITVDISCDRDDADCVANTINGYEGEGNILISWQHGALTDIAKALGDENAPKWKKHSWVLFLSFLFFWIRWFGWGGDGNNSLFSRESQLISRRYDTIWTLPEPYTDITEMTSENCPGLDDN